MGRTESDRIIIAQIAGIASRHASQPRLTGQGRESAITELAAAASGRRDLLAEYAGIVVGHHEGDVNEAHYLRVAQLCLDAGADAALVPAWIAEGRRRAHATASQRAAGR